MPQDEVEDIISGCMVMEEEEYFDGSAEDCVQEATENPELREEAREIGESVDF